MMQSMCETVFYPDDEWRELEEIEDFDGANDLMNDLRVVTGPYAREARQLFREIYSNVYEPADDMSHSTNAGWAEHARCGGEEAQDDGGTGGGEDQQSMDADEDGRGAEGDEDEQEDEGVSLSLTLTLALTLTQTLTLTLTLTQF